jgi:hypothetical protein
MWKSPLSSLAVALSLAIASSTVQASRYDSNFSELDQSMSCSIQKQAQLEEANQQLSDKNSGLREELGRIQGQLSELRKQGQTNKKLGDAKERLESENNRLKDELREINTQTDQYLLICRDYKNQLDQSKELTKTLKDSLKSKDQRILELKNTPAPAAPIATVVNCPEPTVVTVAAPAKECPTVQTVHASQSQAVIPAHEYLILDGIYRLKNSKRAKAILSVRKYLPMPLDKPTYMKLVSEGFDEQNWAWDARSDAVAYLYRYRPRDLTAADINKVLGSSVNSTRNKLLQNLLGGAVYPMSFEQALSIVDGYYDQTNWAQEEKAEAIHLLSFYLPRGLSSDQVFKLVERLTGKSRNSALASLKAKIRTDFTHAQKEQLLNGFYAQSNYGKDNWNKGYDALTPEKRSFIY